MFLVRHMQAAAATDILTLRAVAKSQDVMHPVHVIDVRLIAASWMFI